MKSTSLKIKILSASALVGLSLILATSALAQNSTSVGTAPTQSTSVSTAAPSTFTLSNPLSSQYNSVGGIIEGFVEIFSYLVVIFAVLALIWTGLQFILARGNSDRMKELKEQLLWIVIGVAVVIGARVIITIVLNTLQATGTVNSAVIQKAQNAANGN